MQMADERGADGDLFRYDFGPWMFKEYIGYSSTLRYSFRVLFGVSVEARANAQPPDARGVRRREESHPSAVCAQVAQAQSAPYTWRKDFGDPLYLRRAAGGGRGSDTEFQMVIAKVPQIFNGDGCSARVDDPYRRPLRKAAVVVVQCEPCAKIDAPNSPPGYDRVCSVWKENGCTLKLLLALRCPPRQSVYAPGLDVGTAPGAHDLVHKGAPAVCSGGAAPPPRHADASQPATFFVSLLQGSLELEPPRVAADTPGCVATALGHGPLGVGGVLRSSGGAQPLRIRCVCSGSAAGVVWSNVSVALAPAEQSPSRWNYSHACGGATQA